MKGNTHKRSSIPGTSFRGSGSRFTAGARGPLSFQNISLHEKMTELNRLKSTTVTLDSGQRNITSNEIFATGSFKVTNDISEYSNAKIFNSPGKALKIFTRISKDSDGAIDVNPERDSIEFAIKFFTENSNFDLFTKNIPVKFLSDSEKCDAAFGFLKNKSESGAINPTDFWEFVSSNPESLHYSLMKLCDSATPVGYQHMNTYGERIFTMTNANNEKHFVRFHLKTMQGIRNFTGEEARELFRSNPDFANSDLIRVINEKDFPKWGLKMQVMTPDQASQFFFNAFDLTKIWPQTYFPLIDIGEIELNEIPKNYSAVEKIAFNSEFEMEGINRASDDLGVIYQSDEDHYSQPQLLFNLIMNDYNRESLINNIVNSIHRIEGEERENIIARLISHFFRVDVALGSGVAKGLGVNLISVLNELKKQEMELV